MDYPLFVYGTLRSGSEHAFARLLRETSDLVCTGRLRGSLYRIAGYPGWVEDSQDFVTGEVFQPRDAGSLMMELDEYEGSEYQRVRRMVETASGERECWVYLYVEPVDDKSRLISGDWFESQGSPDKVV